MLSVEEVNNSLILKLSKKLVLDKFKWVKDLRCTDDPNRYNALLFLTIEFDPFLFAKTYNFKVMNYIYSSFETGKGFEFVGNLCVAVNEECGNPIFNELEDTIVKIINTPVRTNAVPGEYKKVLGGRSFRVSRYRVYKDSDPTVLDKEED